MRISDWSSDVCSSDLRWREHSFAFGLDRLLLGYATGDDSEDIGGIAPCAIAEGGDAERLDALVSLLARLHRLSAWLRDQHPAADSRRRLAAESNALLPPAPARKSAV